MNIFKSSFLSGLINGIALCGDLSGSGTVERINELLPDEWIEKDLKNLSIDAKKFSRKI